ncbi:hotdog fold domain-containing protein [Pseudogracilibacillus auburnensis]|uniref:3-aminobutyryl-CoA ammonia lyase n=1 Tax=Pseudogracilibacillus auburnensis TaxID=1494959 RepID=UPI001A96195E|nr:hotdog fold domain-containing protein [Pseudogracilibacillus auburnensis]MBO1003207.1 3-aminobutyryl-CoA ammonia lyase [Pseudogracilibacillus auburnensis]
MDNALLRVRMSQQDAHYGGSLVDGSKVLQLFGDLATELLIKHDGDEGLFLTYENVQFLHPVHAGDFIEAKAQIVHFGNTSRKMEFEAYTVIKSRNDINDSAADFLSGPILVCKAEGVCVVQKEKQRKKNGSEEN